MKSASGGMAAAIDAMKWLLAGSLCSLAVAGAPALAQEAPAEETGARSVDACVAFALSHNASIAEAEARVAEYEARLAEVESVFYPKVQALGYAAPMFTVDGDVLAFERRWKSFGDWGPYLHLQARFVQVLYTFERAEHGENAAREFSKVFEAKAREAELVVALEVRRLAYQHLFARSVLPTLRNAEEVVASALTEAREKYDAGSGEVTMADVAKLEYFGHKIEALRLEAESGAALSLEALKHTMGMTSDTTLRLADETLPRDAPLPDQGLPALLQQAARMRPEWMQLDHGLSAATELIAAEELAVVPVLFVGAELAADWTPMRDDADNPYVYDPYNQVTGGFAVGLSWDFDPALASARSEQAEAMQAQVEALRRFAETGIPLRVVKAHDDVSRLSVTVGLALEGRQAARKWMVFAAAAFETGVGEARELLEGAGAYIEASAAYYGALRDYHVARAELDFAVGRPGP